MSDQKLSKIFLTDSSIDMNFNNNEAYKKGVILSVEDSIIRVDLGEIKEYVEIDLSFGDSVFCKYGSAPNEYFVEGWISKLESEDSIKISIQIHRWGKTERSDPAGKAFDVFLGCIIRNYANEKGIFAMINRISINEGIFASKAKFEENQKILIEVLITDKIIFKSSAIISAVNQNSSGIYYNAKFIDTSVLNKTIINNYIKEINTEFGDEYNRKNSFWKRHSKYNDIAGV